MEESPESTADGGPGAVGRSWAPRVLAASAVVPAEPHDGDLLDAIEECQRQRGRLDSARADLVAKLWDRFRADSTAVDLIVREVALIHAITVPAAARLLVASSRLRQGFATTRSRIECGELPWTHAEVVLVASIDVDQNRLEEFERKALLAVEGCSLGQVKERVRRLVDTMHPEGMTARHREALARRYTSIEPGADGMGWLHLYLDMVDLAAIDDRLTRHAVAAHGDRDEERTLAQLRADTARDLLLADTTDATPEQLATGERTVGSGVRIVPEVHVTVPVLTLLGRSDAPGHLRGMGPIDPETARRCTADAPSLYRILTNPETGAVLSLGAEHYEVTAALRRYLQVRDERCRYPGCSRPAHLCDIDHVKEFARGGPTDHDNLLCLCRRDHQDKDRGWTLRMEPDGTAIWTSPYGRVRITRPAVVIGREGAALAA